MTKHATNPSTCTELSPSRKPTQFLLSNRRYEILICTTQCFLASTAQMFVNVLPQAFVLGGHVSHAVEDEPSIHNGHTPIRMGKNLLPTTLFRSMEAQGHSHTAADLLPSPEAVACSSTSCVHSAVTRPVQPNSSLSQLQLSCLLCQTNPPIT